MRYINLRFTYLLTYLSEHDSDLNGKVWLLISVL